MIHGYPEHPSVLPGGDLVLRVATTAPAFRVELDRFGAGVRATLRSEWLDGQARPPHLPFHDWGRPGTSLHGEGLEPWPAYRLAIPPDWPSGVYVATLVEGDGRGADASPPSAAGVDARSARALVVVRAAMPGRDAAILYKLPLFTYHAYNQAVPVAYDPATARGGWCLYSVPRPDELPIEVPPTVSLRRPGGGTGGQPWDVFNPDPFDPTPRQTFVHWDALAVAWLEAQGYVLDYCTDLDLHRDGAALLRPYRLLLSAGHDEYWSAAMRDGAEAHVAAGGNIAFLGGNTCWYEIRFTEPFAYHRPGPWWETVPERPENLLTGVSYRNGGERNAGHDRTPVGYRVQHADHWVFAGTGLRDGDTFGDREDEHLVGYECDGARFDRRQLAAGRPVRPTCDDGTPASFEILGVGDLAPRGWGLGNAAATMGVYEQGGTVFTASTTDWPRVLAMGRPVVEQITRNVVDRLSAGRALSP